MGLICCGYCYNFVTMQANIQTKHAQQMEGHSTLRNKCICCFQVVHILARRTAPPSSRAPRNGVLVRQGFIPFLHQPFDINNILRGLDRICCNRHIEGSTGDHEAARGPQSPATKPCTYRLLLLLLHFVTIQATIQTKHPPPFLLQGNDCG